MVGNDVVGIGGGDLVEVAAAYVVRLLRLIDRRFNEVLVEHSMMATVALYRLVVKSVDLFTGKEFWLLLGAHVRQRLALTVVLGEPAEEAIVKSEHLARHLFELFFGGVAD